MTTERPYEEELEQRVYDILSERHFFHFQWRKVMKEISSAVLDDMIDDEEIDEYIISYAEKYYPYNF